MLDVIKKRRSHRDFLDKEVEEEKIKEILKAAMFSPSARHQRLWEFIVVKNKKTRDLLAQTKTHSHFVNKAPAVIAIVSPKDESDHYWLEDCFIASTQIYLETTNQGLATCCVQIYGSKRDNGDDCQKYVQKVLNMPQDIQVACLMPIGYPKESLPEHTEEEFEQNKIHWEKY